MVTKHGVKKMTQIFHLLRKDRNRKLKIIFFGVYMQGINFGGEGRVKQRMKISVSTDISVFRFYGYIGIWILRIYRYLDFTHISDISMDIFT